MEWGPVLGFDKNIKYLKNRNSFKNKKKSNNLSKKGREKKYRQKCLYQESTRMFQKVYYKGKQIKR